MNKKTVLFSVFLAFILSSCTYLKYSAVQANYKKLQDAEPSQVNLKHMLDQETFFVWGKPIDGSNRYKQTSMAVAAYSSKFVEHELVDTMVFSGVGTHYGLNLPEGQYTVLVFADSNNNQMFENTELVAQRELSLSIDLFPERVVKDVDVELGPSFTVDWAKGFSAPRPAKTEQSIYYPRGSIRALDDPIFDDRIATLGMYDPASFMEHTHTMFFANEEDQVHKIPVVFVHGIGGSSRSFAPIINQLDLSRYRPWFFYYPSGGDLDQLASFFYSLFLSGDLITLGEMPMIVVAHSMGGLVVREALNRYQGLAQENEVKLFVSIASPMGGHPAAAAGENSGLITLPAWRDLNPSSPFINTLYRKPLPSFVNHQLFYAYRNDGGLKLGENSDGVVPLSSQLHAQAQTQSSTQFGFNSGHVDILSNPKMIQQLQTAMATVDNLFPEDHLAVLQDGGFEVDLSDSYSPISRHLISYAGRYLLFLSEGIIAPVNPEQEHFVQATQAKVSAKKGIERDFIKFMQEHPELLAQILENERE